MLLGSMSLSLSTLRDIANFLAAFSVVVSCVKLVADILDCRVRSYSCAIEIIATVSSSGVSSIFVSSMMGGGG